MKNHVPEITSSRENSTSQRLSWNYQNPVTVMGAVTICHEIQQHRLKIMESFSEGASFVVRFKPQLSTTGCLGLRLAVRPVFASEGIRVFL